MKKLLALLLTLGILLPCLLAGCSEWRHQTGWIQYYTTIDNPVYNDNLEYKFSLYVEEDSVPFFTCMRYRIDIYKSDDLSQPYKTYTSAWLEGISGVDLKHTIVKDPGMNDLYGMYLFVLAADNTITIVNDMKQEVAENGYEATLNKHLNELTDKAVSTIENSCSAYSDSMIQDIYATTLSSVSGTVLDTTTQYLDDIASSVFGQNSNKNLFTTKTIDFLDDLGVYVDAKDVDLTFGMADAAIMFPQKFHQLVQLAFASEENLAKASLAAMQTQCADARLALINFVLAQCGD